MEAPEALAEAVGAVLATLAPLGVRTGAWPVDPHHVTGLHPGERAAVEGAVPKRQREFATGRALLRELIGAPVEILRSPSRAPRLPPGLVGSLTHDADVAAAAVASTGRRAVAGRGRRARRTHASRRGRRGRATGRRGARPRVVFVLKEAAYKAWSGLGGRMLDFHDVRVAVDGDRFEADVVGARTTLEGRFTEAAGRWVALVVVT